MQNKISTRWVLIGFTIIVSIIFLCNDFIFYNSSNSKTPEKILFDSNIINLGLDLRGGKEFLLAPKLEEWLVEKINNKELDQSIRSDFSSALLKADSILKKDEKYILTIDKIESFLQKHTIQELFGQSKEELKTDLQNSLSNNIEIIYNRIDDKGVTEPSIRKLGSEISVEIPGKKNIEKLEELITSSAKLTINEIAVGPGTHYFHKWNQQITELFKNKIDRNEWPDSIKNYITEIILEEDSETKYITIERENFEDFKKEVKKIRRKDNWFETLDFLYLDATSNLIKALLPTNFDINSLKDHKFICLIKKNPVITGDQINKAYVSSNEELITEYQVNIELNESGTKKWADFTSNYIIPETGLNKFAPNVIANPLIGPLPK